MRSEFKKPKLKFSFAISTLIKNRKLHINLLRIPNQNHCVLRKILYRSTTWCFKKTRPSLQCNMKPTYINMNEKIASYTVVLIIWSSCWVIKKKKTDFFLKCIGIVPIFLGTLDSRRRAHLKLMQYVFYVWLWQIVV